MKQLKFPGMNNITAKEGLVMIKVLKREGVTDAKKVMSFMEGIDDALTLQKSASIINRFRGKRKIGKSASQIIHDRLMMIDI
ncbi:hypothetical protein SAMN05216357_112105 [Porphyromonadaceae bacterium KH3CP3RA]|nr:hypothetical protein SAMN05216357_112105 [Porphyromonadaceae bacterium KH3CP3RA]